MSGDDWRASVNSIAKRFLCSYPVQSIAWDERLSAWDAQRELIDATINNVRNIAFPVKVSYRKAFLKWIVSNVERGAKEVNDDVYTALGNVVALPEADTKCYKHYQTECGVVSLCENVQIISEGTTGLITWQAGLALAEWCMAHRDSLEGKTVLELGSGLGLVGLTIALNARAKHVVLSDCHDAVLDQLRQNVALNLTLSKNQREQSAAQRLSGAGVECLLRGCVQARGTGDAGSAISVLRHTWGEEDGALAQCVGADIILAADVVYDHSLFPALADCINACLKPQPQRGVKPELVLVCTERFSLTLDKFINLLRETCEVVEGSIAEQRWFVWTTERPIRFFRATAK